MTNHLTKGISFAYFTGAVIALFSNALNSIFIIFATIIATLLAIPELKRKNNEKLKQWCAIISGVLLIIPFFILKLESVSKLLQPFSDSFTLLGLGIVVYTITKKQELEGSLHEVAQNPYDKQVNNYAYLQAHMAKYEYEVAFEISRYIEKIGQYDRSVLGWGKVHNGWANLYDCLANHYYPEHRQPFYDSYLNEKFKEFLEVFGKSCSKFGALSNPDTHKVVGSMDIFNVDLDVISFSILQNNHSQEKLESGVSDLKEALEIWKEIKESTYSSYERYNVDDVV
ncbi:hypothetical protein H0266_10800 [Halobacillus locisalis]|uniref:Uncharacterized protein n=1 Tax=Halobacillus locisalis TaxID=220753 RepID=A0A838CTB5_9BACI|nr:hypothetical protein [Halobacillus locisalis]MBA2175382.1 hypothetical protein [Halobacillus locisalis]